MSVSSPRTRRLLLAALLATAIALPGAASAFHDQGVANCNGCHAMHDGPGGNVVAGGLLNAPSASDVCLACHGAGPRAVFGGSPLAPPPELGAGNFIFLLEDQINDDPRNDAPAIGGHHAGHSIVAPGVGLAADPDHAVAPGGAFPSAELGCTSCHDPHGNANFRMLHGAGPVQGGLFEFLYPAPDATGLALTLPGVEETPTSHTAYRSGVSDWCANCHGFFHDDVGDSFFEHDYAGDLRGDEADRYDAYAGEQNPQGGDAASAYLTQVPFEDPAATIDGTRGPGPGARLMCLTCHRAHGTSAPAALRWDARVATLGLDGLASGSYALPNPYGDPNQRQLCLKCHDADHAVNSRQSCVLCHARSGADAGADFDGLSP